MTFCMHDETALGHGRENSASILGAKLSLSHFMNPFTEYSFLGTRV